MHICLEKQIKDDSLKNFYVRKIKLMKIKTKAHARIDDINETIEKLLQERKKITEELTKELVAWLMKKDALSHDYDTLIGGILSVLTVIECNDDVSKSQKEAWKKDGTKAIKEKTQTKKIS